MLLCFKRLGFFLPWFILHFLGKKWEFRVQARCSSPRRRHVSSPGSLALRLGEGVCLGKGVVRPGEPGSRFCAALVRLSKRFFT